MASLTFDICPGMEFTRRAVQRAMQTPATSGFVKATNIVDREISYFTARWKGDKPGILREIKRRWDLALGDVREMDFTPPGGDATRVQFESDTLTRVYRSAVEGDVEFVLREVL